MSATETETAVAPPVKHPAAERKRAMFLLVVTSVLWSLGGLLIKEVDWHPLAIAGARSAIAAVVLLAFLGRPRFTFDPVQLGAAACYGATTLLFVAATKLTTSANAILLQYTAPVHVALFSRFVLGERTRAGDWWTILVVLGGMALFFVDELSAGGLAGNILAICAGIAFAWLALLLRRQSAGSPLESILLGNCITALIGVPFAIASPLPGPRGLFMVALLGVFQLGLSYILYSKAIRHVSALEAILIPVLEPLLNPVWVFLFIGERPGPWAVVGGVVVVTAVTWRAVTSTRAHG